METDGSTFSGAQAKSAPEPDDARKPDSPTDLTKPSWKYIATKTVREFAQDQCPDLAAGLTYYAIFSLFPAILVLFPYSGSLGGLKRQRRRCCRLCSASLRGQLSS